jgi:hypothetical protein
MKKFTISILCVAVFFTGLGGLIQETGARFRSDERALELIRQAQTAIGGDDAVRNVRSLSIGGRVTKTFDFDGASITEQGDLEINLQFPNQFAKMMKLGHDGNSTEGKTAEFRKEVKVVVMNGEGEMPLRTRVGANGEKGNVVIVRKGSGEKVSSGDKTADGKARRIITDENIDVIRVRSSHQQNEMFRTTLALLLQAAPETDFTYAGEGDVDGGNCDIVEARSGSSTVKLFLDKSSHLPRMISYQGHRTMIFRIKKDDAKTDSDVRVFERGTNAPETAEFQIRFSDFRAVNGILLPHRWMQTVGGSADEIFDVTNYEINPANIAEKFQNLPPKVFIRTEKNPQ